MEEDAGFKQDTCTYKNWVLPKIKKLQVWSEKSSNPRDAMMNDDARHQIYPLECPKPNIPSTKIEKSRKSLKPHPKSIYLTLCSLAYKQFFYE